MKESLLSREFNWIQNYQIRLASHSQECAIADLVVEEFPNFEAESSYCGGVSIRIYVSSMKEAVAVLSFLRRKGYKYHFHTDQAERSTRNYVVRHVENRDREITLIVQIKKGEAAKCSYQIVGYETVQKPIYKLVCEDGSENASAPSAEETAEATPTSPSPSPSEPSSEPS